MQLDRDGVLQNMILHQFKRKKKQDQKGKLN